jgi:hypothetical protein
MIFNHWVEYLRKQRSAVKSEDEIAGCLGPQAREFGERRRL